MNFVDVIKFNVSIMDVCKAYGVNVNRSGYAKCFRNNEKTPSLKIYEKDNTYHCFSCGEHGDVINLVMEIFGIGFHDAIQKINDDFSFGLNLKRHVSKIESVEMARKSHEKKRESREEKEKKESVRKNYFDLLQEKERLLKNLKEYAPKNENEPMDERFIEAAQEHSRISYLLDCAEWSMNGNAEK